MRKHKMIAVITAAAIAGAVAVPAIKDFTGRALAQTGSILTSVLGTDYVDVYRFGSAVVNSATWATVASYIRGTMLLYGLPGSVTAAASTPEQTLGSYVVPGGTLSQSAGNRIVVSARFKFAANSNVKTVKCYWGATSISSGTGAFNGNSATCRLEIAGVASGQQNVAASIFTDASATPIVMASSVATEYDAGNVTIKATATDASGTAKDTVLQDLWIEKVGS